MSDPIKRSNESSAEANRALRQSAQQQRAAQQEQAARQRRAAQEQTPAKANPVSAQSAAEQNAAVRAAAQARRTSPSAQPSRPVQQNVQPARPVQQSAQPARPVQQSSQPVRPVRRTAQPVRPSAPLYSDRDEAPIRQRRDGQTGCLGGVIYFAFVLSISIILACVGWLAASDVLALNKDPVEATVVLEKDAFTEEKQMVTEEDGTTKEKTVRTADLDYVAKSLKAAGIIRYKSLFKFYCQFSHAAAHIDPGTYELNTNYDYRALVKKMQVGSGAMVTTKVTIPEGYTMEQIFRKLEEENVCAYPDLMDAAANYQYDYSFLDENAIGDASRLEGFLFPDTYEFYQGMQASSAINKFLVNFHNRLTQETLDLAEKRGLSLKQVITIASMIEKEAANDAERPAIASVIYNRLRRDMPLQIDSTVMYVMKEHGDTLTVEDTKIDSPYNTYQNTGLPPTPISNPGASSISAAVKPEDTNFLYYALDADTGVHRFFNDYNAFSNFVASQSYSG